MSNKRSISPIGKKPNEKGSVSIKNSNSNTNLNNYLSSPMAGNNANNNSTSTAKHRPNLFLNNRNTTSLHNTVDTNKIKLNSKGGVFVAKEDIQSVFALLIGLDNTSG